MYIECILKSSDKQFILLQLLLYVWYIINNSLISENVSVCLPINTISSYANKHLLQSINTLWFTLYCCRHPLRPLTPVRYRHVKPRTLPSTGYTSDGVFTIFFYREWCRFFPPKRRLNWKSNIVGRRKSMKKMCVPQSSGSQACAPR